MGATTEAPKQTPKPATGKKAAPIKGGKAATVADFQREIEEAKQARAAEAKAGKPAAGRARPKYPEEITDLVRRAKAARGTTMGAPGAKQHVLVREAVGSKDPLEMVKLSEKALRDIASGKAPTEKLRAAKGLQELGKTFADPFCRGRNLASILVAIVEQRAS